MALTQITKLTPGDCIVISGTMAVVEDVRPYGDAETQVVDSTGRGHILANSNWFELI